MREAYVERADRPASSASRSCTERSKPERVSEACTSVPARHSPPFSSGHIQLLQRGSAPAFTSRACHVPPALQPSTLSSSCSRGDDAGGRRSTGPRPTSPISTGHTDLHRCASMRKARLNVCRSALLHHRCDFPIDFWQERRVMLWMRRWLRMPG